MHEASQADDELDPLTGLLGRVGFRGRLEAAAAQGGGALLYLDVDHFKAVNDALGHDAGDARLRELAYVLLQAAPAEACLSRFGGDEFALLLSSPCQLSEAFQRAEALRQAVEQMGLRAGGREVTISAGVATPPSEPGWTAGDWLELACLRMTAAKKGDALNRNRVWAEALPMHWGQMRVRFLGWPALG